MNLARLLLAFALTLSTHLYAAPYEPQQVVYHINYGDQGRISEAMNNMANHIQALGEANVDIKAVIHGKAIEYFIDANSDQAKQITLDSLRLSDVQFIICGNTLDGYKITHSDLYEVEEEDVVKAGLPEIVHLQQQGYIYVRP